MEGTWLFLILQHKPLSAAAVCAFGDAERIGERGETYMEREVRGEVREMRGWGGGVASHTSAFWQSFDLSPLQCALTRKAAGTPLYALSSHGLIRIVKAVDPSGHR